MDAHERAGYRSFVDQDGLQRMPDPELQKLYEAVRDEVSRRNDVLAQDQLAAVLGDHMAMIHLDRFRNDTGEQRRLWYRVANGLHNAHLVIGIQPDGRGGADLYPACTRQAMHVRTKNQAIAALSVISRADLFSQVDGACEVCYESRG